MVLMSGGGVRFMVEKNDEKIMIKQPKVIKLLTLEVPQIPACAWEGKCLRM